MVCFIHVFVLTCPHKTNEFLNVRIEIFTGLDKIRTLFQDLGLYAQEGVTKIIQAFEGGPFDFIADTLKPIQVALDIFNQLQAGNWSGALQTLISSLTAPLESLSTFFSGISEKIQILFTDLGQFETGTALDTWIKNLSNLASNVGTFFTDLATDIGNLITNLAQADWQSVQQGLQDSR